MKEEVDFRCDFLIEECIIIEAKSIKEFAPINKAQTLNYMKLVKAPKGILVNFNVTLLMKEAHQTFVYNIFRDLPDF
jgi:GxxExxY protein